MILDTNSPSRELSLIERLLLAELESGLPITSRPYSDLGTKLGLSEADVLQIITQLQSQGVIRRFGTVVRHREVGLNSNAMVVWSVPEERASSAGQCLKSLPFVTLCYKRRTYPEWPYNLYCMIHGHDRKLVESQVEVATRHAQLEGCARKILFSSQCFKQQGARYFTSTLQEMDKKIINRLQDGIAVESSPFAAAAKELEVPEELLLARLQTMLQDGRLSRFGPMFNVEKFGGVFTLAALAVPRDRFDEVMGIVNSFSQVAHNYEREHQFNMWFVVATESQAETDRVLQEIEAATGLRVISLPKLEEYYLNLKLNL